MDACSAVREFQDNFASAVSGVQPPMSGTNLLEGKNRLNPRTHLTAFEERAHVFQTRGFPREKHTEQGDVFLVQESQIALRREDAGHGTEGLEGREATGDAIVALALASTGLVPEAITRTRTSPGPAAGRSISRSSNRSGPPNLGSTIARISSPLSPCCGCGRDSTEGRGASSCPASTSGAGRRRMAWSSKVDAALYWVREPRNLIMECPRRDLLRIYTAY